MKFAFRVFSGIFMGVGAFAILKLFGVARRGDWAAAWLLFMTIVGCYWIAFLLYRGANRPLK